MIEYGETLANVYLVKSYSPTLVTLSILIAIFASYTAFSSAERYLSAISLPSKLRWNLFGAVTMGIGIWSMHFIGVLALKIHLTVGYDIYLTILSIIPAIAACGIAIWVMTHDTVKLIHLVTGGSLLGIGIGTMHFTGMMAMRVNATMTHDPLLFYLSIIIAVLLATTALAIQTGTLNKENIKKNRLRQVLSSIVMGASVSGMHYTAMASVNFTPNNSSEILIGIKPDSLSVMVTISTLIVLAFGLLVPRLERYKQTTNELDKLSHIDHARIVAIVNSTQDALIQIDRYSKIIGWNYQAENIFGWSQQEAIGQPLFKLIIPPRSRRNHLVGMSRFLEHGDDSFLNKVIEAKALHHDGHEFPIEVIASPIKIGDDYEFSAFIRDITKRKLAEDKLQLSDRVYENTQEGILITDAERNIIDVNPAFSVITGYSREEILGKNPSILSSGKQDNQFYQRMWQSIDETGYWQGELWNRKKNGELYAERLNLSTLKN